MKLIYFIAFSVFCSTSLFAQQTYISKKQIKIGNYSNGKVHIDQSEDTFIFKTDFNFQPTIGADYTLDLITDDNKVEHQHLKLKVIKMNRDEKIYQFAVEELGDDYPNLYLQITKEPHANFSICVVIKNEVGQFMFYCNKI